MPRRALRESEKVRMRRLRGQDAKRWTYAALGKEFSCSTETAYRAINGSKNNRRWAEKDPEPAEGVPPPKRWDEIEPRYRELLEPKNFQRWREEFFVRPLAWAPFHQEMAEAVCGDADTIVLVPPGHAKTTTCTHDLPIHEMLRHRARGEFFSCLLVSQTDNMGRAFVARIRRTLERNKALIAAYGGFKPEEDAMWREAALRVWGFEDPEGVHEEKEPTFISAGRGTQVYGWRVRRIIADDLIGQRETLDPDATAKILEWVHEDLESRLEPGGHIAIVGTRFSPHELYGRLLEARGSDDDEPLYRPVIFKAHDETRCKGEACVCKGPCEHHPAQPAGCTLWPQKWPWRTLRRIRDGMNQGHRGRFEFVYNQEETSAEAGICSKEWFDACRDLGREAWEIPGGGRLSGACVCSIDPAAANWTAAQCWIHVPSRDATVDVASHYLIAQERARLTGPQIIDLMRSWTLRLRGMGLEPTWVVEVNSFQRWLTQFSDYRQMVWDLNGLNVVKHSTGINKLDNEFGVRGLGRAFEYRKVSVPWAARHEWDMFEPFRREMITYPDCDTSDTLMAAWIYFHYAAHHATGAGQDWIEDPSIPPYLLERRRKVAVYA